MKNFLFVLFFLSSITCLKAQNHQNFIGGAANFNTLNERLTFNLQPYYGRVISEQWSIGVQLGFGSNIFKPKTPTNQSTGFSRNTYSTGLFGRYRFSSDNKLSFIIVPNVNYSYERSIQRFVAISTAGIESSVKETRNSQIVTFDTTFGFVYDISDKLNVILNIGNLSYRIFKVTTVDTGEINLSKRFDSSFNSGSIEFGVELKF